ncbi:hypothetical protein EHM92_07435, partial [bacterium]
MNRARYTTLLLAFLLLGAFARASDNAGKIPISTSSKEAMDYFLAGRTLVENLQLTDAIAQFKKAADKDPSFAL